MKITDKWLEENGACQEAKDWIETIRNRDIKNIFDIIIFSKDSKKLFWGNWMIVRLMNFPQKIQYAVFAAEQVLNIFEEEYPDDDRPRKAIEVARNYLKNPNEGDAHAIVNTAYVVEAAEVAAYAVAGAARVAACAAYAVRTACVTTYVVIYTVKATVCITDNHIELLTKILIYGMELINQ